MNTIKFIAVSLLVQVLAIQTLVAQNFYGSSVNYVDQKLDESFTDYYVFILDQDAIYDYAYRQGDAEFRLNLTLDDFGDKDFAWQLDLQRRDIRHSSFTEVAMTEQGNVVLPKRDCITYAGYSTDRVGTVSESRFTISADLLIGMVESGEELFFIEPLARLSFGAPEDYFIVYNTKDVIEDASLQCGYEEVVDHRQDENEGLLEDSHVERSATPNCTEVDLALAGAYDMYTKYGSVQAVSDHMLSITSLMEALYDDFDFDYIVRTIFVPTSLAADPWTSSTTGNTLLSSFRTWGPTGFSATHDIGQLWTDRNLLTGAGSGGLVGIAYVGQVCLGSRYNVCEDYTTDFNRLRVLSAHEIGHNWSATHTTQIMNSSVIASATSWDLVNIAQILAHKATRTCLSDCSATCPFAYALVDWISDDVWEYEALISITANGQLSGPSDVTYDAGSLIILLDGFNATSVDGGVFNAILDGCSSPLAPPADVSRLPSASTEESGSDGELADGSTLKFAFAEMQVFPNPIVKQVTVSFSMTSGALVEALLFDMTGKLMTVPFAAQEFSAGSHRLQWDCSELPQGSYLLKLSIGGEVQTALLTVVR